jgi:hypothetical protein
MARFQVGDSTAGADPDDITASGRQLLIICTAFCIAGMEAALTIRL